MNMQKMFIRDKTLHPNVDVVFIGVTKFKCSRPRGKVGSSFVMNYGCFGQGKCATQ